MLGNTKKKFQSEKKSKKSFFFSMDVWTPSKSGSCTKKIDPRVIGPVPRAAQCPAPTNGFKRDLRACVEGEGPMDLCAGIRVRVYYSALPPQKKVI